HQRRNAAHAKLPGDLRAVVDVHFADFHGAGILTRQLVDQRSDHAAGTAPRGPKVDQHRFRRFKYFGVEIGVGKLGGVGAHGETPWRKPLDRLEIGQFELRNYRQRRWFVNATRRPPSLTSIHKYVVDHRRFAMTDAA